MPRCHARRSSGNPAAVAAALLKGQGMESTRSMARRTTVGAMDRSCAISMATPFDCRMRAALRDPERIRPVIVEQRGMDRYRSCESAASSLFRDFEVQPHSGCTELGDNLAIAGEASALVERQRVLVAGDLNAANPAAASTFNRVVD